MNPVERPVLIFYVIWTIAAGIGAVRPKTYLSLIKWQSQIWGKISGFDIKAKSDESVLKRTRLFHTIFFIIGLLILLRNFFK